MEALNTEWSKVSQDLYNAAQQEAQAANGATSDSTEPSNEDSKNTDDNVENVDYEVVDDEKDK